MGREGLDGNVVEIEVVGVGAGAGAVGDELVELGVGDGVGIGEGPVDAVGEVDVEAVGVVGAVVEEGDVGEGAGGQGDEDDIVVLEADGPVAAGVCEDEKMACGGVAQADPEGGVGVVEPQSGGAADDGVFVGGVGGGEVGEDGGGAVGVPGQRHGEGPRMGPFPGDKGGLGVEPSGGSPAGLAGEVAFGIGVEVVPEVFGGGGGGESGEKRTKQQAYGFHGSSLGKPISAEPKYRKEEPR